MKLLPTTIVGSYPQPEWLIDRSKLAGRFPPRVRARELWRIAPEFLQEAQDDATIMAIKAQVPMSEMLTYEQHLTSATGGRGSYISVSTPHVMVTVHDTRAMATYADMEELIRLGAYRKGSSPEVDEAIGLHGPLETFLSQGKEESTSLTEAYTRLEQIIGDAETEN